jgi:molecular chaperone IbpA
MNFFTKDVFKDFDRVSIGFDDHISRIMQLHNDLTKNIPNYPPFNIKKTGENTYQIELAVAGFSKHDIDIELANNKMIITGNSQSQDLEDSFLFKGIGMRPFTRTFALDDHVEIQSAEMVNGMLKIFLEKMIPENKKPKKVKVRDSSTDPLNRDL